MRFSIWYGWRLVVRRPVVSLGILWLCFTGVFAAVAFTEVLPMLSQVHVGSRQRYTAQLYVMLFLCLSILLCSLYTLLREDFRRYSEEYATLRRCGCRSWQLVLMLLFRLTLLYILAAPPALLLVRVYGKGFVDHCNRVMHNRPWQQTFAGTIWSTPWVERTFTAGADWAWILPIGGVVVLLAGFLAWVRAGSRREEKKHKRKPLDLQKDFLVAYAHVYRRRSRAAFLTTGVGIVVSFVLPVMLFCAALPSVPNGRDVDIFLHAEDSPVEIPYEVMKAVTELPGVEAFQVFSREARGETTLCRTSYDLAYLWLAEEDWAETAQAVIQVMDKWRGAADWVRISKIDAMDHDTKSQLNNEFLRLQSFLLTIAASVQLYFIAASLLRERRDECMTLYHLGLSAKDVAKLQFTSIVHCIHPPMQVSAVLAILLYLLFSYGTGENDSLYTNAVCYYAAAAAVVFCLTMLVAGLSVMLEKSTKSPRRLRSDPDCGTAGASSR